MKAKSNARDEARVAEILAIVLDGGEPWDVRQYVAEKVAAKEPPWDEAPTSAKKLADYLAQAERQIAAASKQTQPKLLKRHLAQRRNLYAKAVSQGDVRAALACLRDEAMLEKLYDRSKDSRRGGKGKVALIPATGTPADVVQLLATTIEQLAQGQIDTKTASAIGTLAVLRMKAQAEANQAAETGKLLEMTQPGDEAAGDDAEEDQ